MIVLTVAIILRLKIGRLIPRKIAVVKSLFLLTAYKFQFLAAAKLNCGPRREAETSVRRQLQLMSACAEGKTRLISSRLGALISAPVVPGVVRFERMQVVCPVNRLIG